MIIEFYGITAPSMSCICFGSSTLEKERISTRADKELDIDLLENVKQISFNELRSASDDFHSNNRIGRGGFGTVYKGTLRNGVQVAIKKLSIESKQGAREFLTEIKTISNIRHPNLVELIGCCSQKASRILVYEYLENNSLDHALLDPKKISVHLDWRKRSSICIGTARGLQFLHEEAVPHIVHRDIKASNILLDKDFNPKIGDFGLAKLFPDDITHISTRIAGTTGYLAPEYALGGQLTLKADVYSFGVLILELVSGKRSSTVFGVEISILLLGRVWELYEEGKLLDIVDPRLGDYPQEEVLRYMKVALFCTQAAANRRPVMSQVIDMLTKNNKLNEKLLTAPGFYGGLGTSDIPSVSKKTSNASSSNEMSFAGISITKITPR
ncbi:putative serine/threonine-protein kinase isoform X1 [Cucumis sativus]|uniref:putative serine/threonine-protein kinase isoform X1 n=2 Tax=Cucumis sativus TaxID=3659 RepID=UPI0002B47FBC|nr:putative serine/threonine-protein kinase isoform X1 [Cucumis sativus]